MTAGFGTNDIIAASGDDAITPRAGSMNELRLGSGVASVRLGGRSSITGGLGGADLYTLDEDVADMTVISGFRIGTPCMTCTHRLACW